jgi:NDP-sugar pyrophosphorylase family protein
MNKMAIIITMAGLGSRFREAGYNVPKFMIEARGKSLFEWSLDSLIDYNTYVYRYVFVVRKEDNASVFIREKCAKYGIHEINILEIDKLTDGQATTCMLALPYVLMDNPIMVYNIDTYIEPYQLKYDDIRGDGFIPCFHAEGDHWSFVKLDKNGKAVEVREKDRISDNCSLGAYYFSSANLYKDVYNKYYDGDLHLGKKEKYIAPLYNLMIKYGYQVNICNVPEDKVHVLGTPKELEIFIKSE